MGVLKSKQTSFVAFGRDKLLEQASQLNPIEKGRGNPARALRLYLFNKIDGYGPKQSSLMHGETENKTTVGPMAAVGAIGPIFNE